MPDTPMPETTAAETTTGERLTPERIAAVAERLRAHRFQAWFYGDSIGFEGLIAAADLTGAREHLDFVHGFLRAWAARREPWRPDDNTAPGHVLCALAERLDDALLREAALDLGRHLRGRRRVGAVPRAVSITFEDTLRSLREPYGGVALSPEQAARMRDPGPGVWLDCLHFDPPFFAHLDRIAPGEGWAEAALAECHGYRDLLLDEETGLYRHFWLERAGRAYARGWGRGQGWALLGLLDVAALLPDAAEVRAEALRLARRMLAHQLPDGHWWSLVHEPRSGPESSTAAFMATAFFRGMSLGLLPQEEFAEPAKRAYRAMEGKLDAEGNLRGVSAAVYSALVEEHYWHVPVDRIVPWGQGPALTAAAARAAWRGGQGAAEQGPAGQAAAGQAAAGREG